MGPSFLVPGLQKSNWHYRELKMASSPIAYFIRYIALILFDGYYPGEQMAIRSGKVPVIFIDPEN